MWTFNVTERYVTGGVDEQYLENLERQRADNIKNKVQYSEVSSMEGKGGGGTIVNGRSGVHEEAKAVVGCSGPMNGADDTVGLHNTWMGVR